MKFTLKGDLVDNAYGMKDQATQWVKDQVKENQEYQPYDLSKKGAAPTNPARAFYDAADEYDVEFMSYLPRTTSRFKECWWNSIRLKKPAQNFMPKRRVRSPSPNISTFPMCSRTDSTEAPSS